MPFDTPKIDDVHAAMLRDLVNQMASVNTHPDSDFYIRAKAVASAVDGLYTHQQWIVKQIFPDTADSEFLELHARVRGLERKPAARASGSVEIQGLANVRVAPGLLMMRSDGVEYQSVAEVVLDSEGLAMVQVVALEGEELGNSIAGEVLNVKNGGQNVTSAKVVDVKGGLSEEDDQSLLGRLLEIIRRPPAGGNKYDYKRWALEVPGVTQAYVYPLRRGLGTVDVVVLTDDDAPGLQTLEAVKKHIDDVRPVTAKDVAVIAPIFKNVDIEIEVVSSDLDEATRQITDNLQLFFNGLEPGQLVVKSKLDQAVSKLNIVNDHVINKPSGNVEPDYVELCRLGAITVKRMTA